MIKDTYSNQSSENLDKNADDTNFHLKPSLKDKAEKIDNSNINETTLMIPSRIAKHVIAESQKMVEERIINDSTLMIKDTYLNGSSEDLDKTAVDNNSDLNSTAKEEPELTEQSIESETKNFINKQLRDFDKRLKELDVQVEKRRKDLYSNLMDKNTFTGFDEISNEVYENQQQKDEEERRKQSIYTGIVSKMFIGLGIALGGGGAFGCSRRMCKRNSRTSDCESLVEMGREAPVSTASVQLHPNSFSVPSTQPVNA